MKLLIVDDDPFIIDYLGVLCHRIGVDYVSAQSPFDAYQAFLKSPAEFSGLIVDLYFPGDFDGLWLAQRIRNENSKIQIMFVTAYDSRHNQALHDSITSYGSILSKPFFDFQAQKAIEDLISLVKE